MQGKPCAVQFETHMDENIENYYVTWRLGSDSSDQIIFLTFLKVRKEKRKMAFNYQKIKKLLVNCSPGLWVNHGLFRKRICNSDCVLSEIWTWWDPLRDLKLQCIWFPVVFRALSLQVTFGWWGGSFIDESLTNFGPAKYLGESVVYRRTIPQLSKPFISVNRLFPESHMEFIFPFISFIEIFEIVLSCILKLGLIKKKY